MIQKIADVPLLRSLDLSETGGTLDEVCLLMERFSGTHPAFALDLAGNGLSQIAQHFIRRIAPPHWHITFESLF